MHRNYLWRSTQFRGDGNLKISRQIFSESLEIYWKAINSEHKQIVTDCNNVKRVFRNLVKNNIWLTPELPKDSKQCQHFERHMSDWRPPQKYEKILWLSPAREVIFLHFKDAQQNGQRNMKRCAPKMMETHRIISSAISVNISNLQKTIGKGVDICGISL